MNEFHKTLSRAFLNIGILLQMFFGFRFEAKIENKIVQVPTEYERGFNKKRLRKNKWNKPRDFWKK